MLASLLFGLVPALHASKPRRHAGVERRRRVRRRRPRALRQLLVVGQITLAVTLLVGAALVVRSLDRIVAGPGFDPRPVITVRLRPGLLNYPTERALAFQRNVIARLESLPGVVSASPGDGMVTTPLYVAGGQRVTVVGDSGAPDQELDVRQTRVGPRYFATLRVPVLEGREFDDRDHAGGPRVVTVNDVLAKQIAPDGRVSGRTLIVRGAPHRDRRRDQRRAVLRSRASVRTPWCISSYWQPDPRGGFNRDSRTFIRVAGDPAAMMATIRREIAAVDPAVPISEDYPLSEPGRLRVSIGRHGADDAGELRRARARAERGRVCTVSLRSRSRQRTREIGVRVALGAGTTRCGRAGAARRAVHDHHGRGARTGCRVDLGAPGRESSLRRRRA